MKKNGSKFAFIRERNDDLMRAYRFQIAQSHHIQVREISRAMVEMPSSRFWVSSERATIVVKSLLRGLELPSSTRPTKREMFMEIFRRFRLLREARPDLSDAEIVRQIVNSPAPKFYLLPSTAMYIIWKIRNGYFDKILGKRN